ncbi:MAG: phosphoglycerate mutase family protein [Candidatus Paceibacterota bacterium]|jgi:NAD+ kinase
MALPIDLVLVRHGQSEGNIAKRRSESGDHEAFTPEFRNRHSASFRLTDLGREQAKKAGIVIRNEFPAFDRHFVSEYLRAMETAAHLLLPEASWRSDFYLTERDWGELDICPENERDEKFGEALRRRETNPFFWRPPGGETFADLCLRVDRVLHTLHRECNDKRVIIVCHGEVMRAFQIRIERMSQSRFRDLAFSHQDEDRIYNCQIIHYSRRENGVGLLAPYVGWVRTIRPTAEPLWISKWSAIKRPHYSNADLLEIVSHVAPMLK